MRLCLGTMPNTRSAMVRNNNAHGMMPETSKAWEGHNSLNTCLDEASEESIAIYAKSRCQWNGGLIDSNPEP